MFFLVLLTGALLAFLITLLGYEGYKALEEMAFAYFDSFFHDPSEDLPRELREDERG